MVDFSSRKNNEHILKKCVTGRQKDGQTRVKFRGSCRMAGVKC